MHVIDDFALRYYQRQMLDDEVLHGLEVKNRDR